MIEIGRFVSDEWAVNIPVGFEPDYVRLIAKGASSGNMVSYEWFKMMESIDGIDGISKDGATDAEEASGDGITGYDTGTETPTVTEWSASATVVARSATADGTFYKATTSGVDVNGNRIDRSEIFECVTAGTTGSSEPVWPTVVGENGPSDNGVVWQKVNKSTVRGGYKGFSLAASMTGLANGDVGFFIAMKADRGGINLGDVDGWPSGIQPE